MMRTHAKSESYYIDDITRDALVSAPRVARRRTSIIILRAESDAPPRRAAPAPHMAILLL